MRLMSFCAAAFVLFGLAGEAEAVDYWKVRVVDLETRKERVLQPGKRDFVLPADLAPWTCVLQATSKMNEMIVRRLDCGVNRDEQKKAVGFQAIVVNHPGTYGASIIHLTVPGAVKPRWSITVETNVD